MLYLQLAFALHGRQFGQRPRQPLLQLCQPGHGIGIGIARFAARYIGGNHQPDLLTHMIEGQHLVEEEQACVGNSQLVFG